MKSLLCLGDTGNRYDMKTGRGGEVQPHPDGGQTGMHVPSGQRTSHLCKVTGWVERVMTPASLGWTDDSTMLSQGDVWEAVTCGVFSILTELWSWNLQVELCVSMLWLHGWMWWFWADLTPSACVCGDTKGQTYSSPTHSDKRPRFHPSWHFCNFFEPHLLTWTDSIQCLFSNCLLFKASPKEKHCSNNHAWLWNVKHTTCFGGG